MLLFLVQALLWFLRVLLAGYVVYYVGMAVFALFRAPGYPARVPVKRFAVVVPARNEALVVDRLIESLTAQDYPRELFDVFVVTNRCTDDTAETARRAGANVLECTVPTSSKGEVLAFTFPILLEKRDGAAGDGGYDAFIVFDADNIADPGFLRAMNDAACAGVRVGQCYRDSKNPGDTVISQCMSLYYWSLDRFINHARGVAGLSAMINGTGFMIDAAWLRSTGGWNTKTLAEDIEYTTQCLLRGQKVAWIPKAVTYDEQPLSSAQSWTQRLRWSSGVMQSLRLYGAGVTRGVFRPGGFRLFDLLLNYAAPITHLLYVFTIVAEALLRLSGLHQQLFPGSDTLYRFLLSVPVSCLASSGIALIVAAVERKGVRRMMRGILAYGFFLYSWVPINFLSVFRTRPEWREIRHTRTLGIQDMARDAAARKG
ncbi:MAG: glycosyltransferase family 2 protein [Clostridia bacterium]|nr:glycosyltransferase family 2 protein [Clostridia bacterium]